MSLYLGNKLIANSQGGGSGTTDYKELIHKPTINDTILEDNITTTDLSLSDNSTIIVTNDEKLETVAIRNNNDQELTKVWTGTLAEYNAISEKDPNTIYNITDDIDAKVVYQNGTHNVGDIFFTSRLDEVLNGAVPCDGGTYQLTDYIGRDNIGELLRSNKLDYISLTDYTTAISTKGWCDKIGWDGGSTISFRVPTLTPHIVQKNNIPVVGNGMTLGFTDGTNISGMCECPNIGNDVRVDSYGKPIGSTAGSQGLGDYNKTIGITTDPDKSGIIADTSDTAQLRVMIQLSTGVSEEAIDTCKSVKEDISTLKGYDYVVDWQVPTEENNYTWYRLYKSGWVEQGGQIMDATITFPVAFSLIPTITLAAGDRASSGGGSYNIGLTALSATTFSVERHTEGINKAYWQASGMAAQGE